MVPADSLLELMRRIESAGVPTRFPHAAHVYRALLAKEWTTAVSGCGPSQMRVPATTRVSASSVARVPFSAAKRAVDALRAIKGDECDRGVVKLGYSWEAVHVRTFTTGEELATVLASRAGGRRGAARPPRAVLRRDARRRRAIKDQG